MNNKKVEVNGRIIKKDYLEDIIKICERCFIILCTSRLIFRDLSCFGLKKEELNKVLGHLDDMENILTGYYGDLNRIKEENNG